MCVGYYNLYLPIALWDGVKVVLGEGVGHYSLYLPITLWVEVDEDLGECVDRYNLYLPIAPDDGMEEVFR